MDLDDDKTFVSLILGMLSLIGILLIAVSAAGIFNALVLGSVDWSAITAPLWVPMLFAAPVVFLASMYMLSKKIGDWLIKYCEKINGSS